MNESVIQNGMKFTPLSGMLIIQEEGKSNPEALSTFSPEESTGSF